MQNGMSTTIEEKKAQQEEQERKDEEKRQKRQKEKEEQQQLAWCRALAVIAVIAGAFHFWGWGHADQELLYFFLAAAVILVIGRLKSLSVDKDGRLSLELYELKEKVQAVEQKAENVKQESSIVKEEVQAVRKTADITITVWIPSL